ncbi:hypothetical protein ORI89_16770 [Sphingobacterium sp. UT-1RO-CII-1]|uniref:hypothetical protein n=1 Tax=Sphingobacterium sp. UT-1RO-CII-1 TaxID=2995225 RepID=UPI00227C4CAA|nr:hypothetical protein [Sphingobacterium sp. UT-1RO-CII-1]MCY4781313.1 hypothetical protein [Sphingobacterium sp. UT-1RO-CII-1]
MRLKGAELVSVDKELPADGNTYLFIDSSGIASAMYADVSIVEYLIAVGYDYWVKAN